MEAIVVDLDKQHRKKKFPLWIEAPDLPVYHGSLIFLKPKNPQVKIFVEIWLGEN